MHLTTFATAHYCRAPKSTVINILKGVRLKQKVTRCLSLFSPPSPPPFTFLVVNALTTLVDAPIDASSRERSIDRERKLKTFANNERPTASVTDVTRRFLEANRSKGNFAGACRRLLWLDTSLLLASHSLPSAFTHLSVPPCVYTQL